ncbi:MAG TPA: phosphotransferase [Longimicrobium sp.]|nr:phosphotransferase [Longimicrobium sp.]
MTHPWAAEHEVTAELALELVREQFPELGARRVEPFGSGWDNTAFLVDGHALFRFPRKESTVELLERETRVLPRIAPRLPLAIPVPRWIGRPTERFPWTFAGYPRLAGVTACAAHLSEGERRAAAAPLGEFLAALHATPAVGLGLPGDEIRRTDFRMRMPKLLERMEEVRPLIGDPAPWLSLFDGELPGPPARESVVHGDLYVRHLLVDGARRVCGVIDWGDLHAGDPAVDLTILWAFLPRPARAAFAAAYGPIDERTRRMARLRAAYHSVNMTWFAHSIGDGALLRESLLSLRHVLEE